MPFNKERYHTDPDYKQQKLDKNKEYRQKNHDKIVAQNRERRWRKKQERVNQLGGCCVGCGETNIDLLQFDHIDRTKKTGVISRLTNEQLKTELYNCQVLCKECHRIKTMVHHDNNPILQGYKLASIDNTGDRIVITYELH
tara:strand:- start:164 stop:586 length:423 start_codon:yes stop_codon:yes gene_type:complete